MTDTPIPVTPVVTTPVTQDSLLDRIAQLETDLAAMEADRDLLARQLEIVRNDRDDYQTKWRALLKTQALKCPCQEIGYAQGVADGQWDANRATRN